MSMAICCSTAAQFNSDMYHSSATQILPPHKEDKTMSQNTAHPPAAAAPYIHPLVRQSNARMNQISLEMCTESLGSETGCRDFDNPGWFSMLPSSVAEEKTCQQDGFTEVTNGSYHGSSRRSPPRSFPPPLSSISRRNGTFVQMRSHRRNGHLVLEAVPVASHNFLQVRRLNGRLLLSLVNTDSRISESKNTMQNEEQVKEPEEVNYGEEDGDAVEYEEEEEEEVEVVDRGTVVEVKISTQKQQQSGAKVLRSSIMINKFVGGAPLSNEERWAKPPVMLPNRRMPPATTAVAAAVAASYVSASMEVAGHTMSATKSKLFFTYKWRNREEMLHNMRRCSELRRSLFFWEPCCIAAAS